MIHPLERWGVAARRIPSGRAVVGLGYWGPNLVRNLHEHPDAEVVAVCDFREEALDKIARRYPSVRTTTELETILADESIEARRDRDPGLVPLRARVGGAQRRQARLHREAARCVRRGGA